MVQDNLFWESISDLFFISMLNLLFYFIFCMCLRNWLLVLANKGKNSDKYSP